MITDRTISRLRWHAGLDETGKTDGLSSIASNTWPKGRLTPNFQKAVTDCLDTLVILNREINGDVPSSSSVWAKDLPRSLVYAMTEITRMIRNSQEQAQDQNDANALSRAVKQLETAWSAVLAGDIDNILEHIAQEVG